MKRPGCTAAGSALQTERTDILYLIQTYPQVKDKYQVKLGQRAVLQPAGSPVNSRGRKNSLMVLLVQPVRQNGNQV